MAVRYVDIRVVRASIEAHVKANFTSPPAETGWSRPYNVYGIVEMANELFSPVDPYVYVISEHAEPTTTRIPMVVIDPVYTIAPYQLGSRTGAFIDMQLHCWGGLRAERDDIATMLANVYGGRTQSRPSTIPVWTSLSDNTVISTAEVISQPQISFPSAGGALAAEGTLRNWAIVSFRLRVK